MTLFLVLQAQVMTEGLRAGIIFTARYSLVLFMITFAASALKIFPRQPLFDWVRKNRRYLGLSFAVSHLLHGITIVLLYFSNPELFRQIVSTVSLVGGVVGFVAIFIMAITSNDLMVKKIGFTRWKKIHTVGSYYLWVVFLVSYLGMAFVAPVYWLLVAFLVLIAATKIKLLL